jgi:hypothetical protein
VKTVGKWKKEGDRPPAGPGPGRSPWSLPRFGGIGPNRVSVREWPEVPALREFGLLTASIRNWTRTEAARKGLEP